MKKTLILLVFAVICGRANSTTLTVSNATNLPGSPGQYTTLQAAVTAAFAGDTILIHGSPNIYAGATLTKKLTILGPGYNPQKQNALVANFFYNNFITFGNGCSNSLVAGLTGVNFNCSNSVLISNITIKRNSITSNAGPTPGIALNSNCSGFIIEQNDVLIFSPILLNGATNTQIRNNIIATSVGGSSSPTNHIKNNLFINLWDAFGSISNTDISNNIFYQCDPLDAANSGVTLSTYNNNLTYSCANGNIPRGSNVGSGNIINQDPVFLNAPDNANNYTTYNWRLHPTSPALNAGTDGTDIGPTGGASPIYIYPTGVLTGEPPIPQVYYEVVPTSSVPLGGSFNVNVKARKKN